MASEYSYYNSRQMGKQLPDAIPTNFFSNMET